MGRCRQTAAVLTVAGCVGASAGLSQGAANRVCQATRGLQDSACTPGAVFSGVTAKQVCRPGYSSSVRSVPDRVKRAVFTEYGIAGSHHGGAYEVDHLISLELGGHPTDPRNLWPEPYPRASEVDQIENQLNAEVCSGQLALAEAQQREDDLKHTQG